MNMYNQVGCMIDTSFEYFLDASSHHYKRPCPSVRWSVTLSSKSMKNGHLRILNDLDSTGGGKIMVEEDGGIRR